MTVVQTQNQTQDTLPDDVGLVRASTIQQLVNVSESHFFNLVREGKFPPPAVKIGRRFTRWHVRAVFEWLENPQAWIDANAPRVGGERRGGAA